MKKINLNLDKKEIFRFVVSGISAVATDTLLYFILINFLIHSASKSISFVSGTVVAYFINKFWTFKQNKKSVSEVLRFAILYFLTFLANVGVNKMALNILTGSTIIAFLFATATSTLLNFIGQKYWVFKKTQTL